MARRSRRSLQIPATMWRASTIGCLAGSRIEQASLRHCREGLGREGAPRATGRPNLMGKPARPNALRTVGGGWARLTGRTARHPAAISYFRRGSGTAPNLGGRLRGAALWRDAGVWSTRPKVAYPEDAPEGQGDSNRLCVVERRLLVPQRPNS